MVSIDSKGDAIPSEMDIFLTIRHYGVDGKESKCSPCLRFRVCGSQVLNRQTVFYTGTTGEPVPVVKGWLRLSLRKVNNRAAGHEDFLPHREYLSTDVDKPVVGQMYPEDVEIWPTNVIVGKGHKLALQIAAHDTQGSGLFEHTHPEDRPRSLLAGLNCIHVGPKEQSWLTLPIVPVKEDEVEDY